MCAIRAENLQRGVQRERGGLLHADAENARLQWAELDRAREIEVSEHHAAAEIAEVGNGAVIWNVALVRSHPGTWARVRIFFETNLVLVVDGVEVARFNLDRQEAEAFQPHVHVLVVRSPIE